MLTGLVTWQAARKMTFCGTLYTSEEVILSSQKLDVFVWRLSNLKPKVNLNMLTGSLLTPILFGKCYAELSFVKQRNISMFDVNDCFLLPYTQVSKNARYVIALNLD